MQVKELIGSGDRIARQTAPFLVVGLAANLWRPSWFSVGGPSPTVSLLTAVLLVPGVVCWAWSVYLILTRVPRGELITTGPFALVKHPLYTAVGLLVLPGLGLWLDSWLGAVLGLIVYLGARRFAPEEEQALSRTFSARWEEYRRGVVLPWL
jgi:protein-S-isoprenylcysteine O-methyltransferase Ste14